MFHFFSVGIAMSGGSKVVLLDEPSTGLDVSGKRDLWDMLLKFKVRLKPKKHFRHVL